MIINIIINLLQFLFKLIKLDNLYKVCYLAIIRKLSLKLYIDPFDLGLVLCKIHYLIQTFPKIKLDISFSKCSWQQVLIILHIIYWIDDVLTLQTQMFNILFKLNVSFVWNCCWYQFLVWLNNITGINQRL